MGITGMTDLLDEVAIGVDIAQLRACDDPEDLPEIGARGRLASVGRVLGGGEGGSEHGVGCRAALADGAILHEADRLRVGVRLE